MTPTDQRLREIAEREKKATKGPWHYQEESDAYTHIVRGPDRFFVVQFGQDTTGQSEANARYMANSRQDVPWLLALIKKQRKALEFIATQGESVCKHLCSEDYIPRGRHAPECPIDYFATARDALNFSPENL